MRTTYHIAYPDEFLESAEYEGAFDQWLMDDTPSAWDRCYGNLHADFVQDYHCYDAYVEWLANEQADHLD